MNNEYFWNFGKYGIKVVPNALEMGNTEYEVWDKETNVKLSGHGDHNNAIRQVDFFQARDVRNG